MIYMSKERSRSLDSNKSSFRPFGVLWLSQSMQQSGLVQFQLQQHTPWDVSDGRAIYYADFWDFWLQKVL